MKKTLLKSLLFLLITLAINEVQAQQSIAWTGAQDSNFDNAFNWETFTVPLYKPEYTRCDIAAAVPCVLNRTIPNDSLGTYVVRPGATFTIKSSVVFVRAPYSNQDHYLGGATVNIENGAIVNVRRSAWIGSSSTGADAIYNIKAGSEFIVGNNFSVSERKNATINVDGGTLTVQAGALRLGAYPQYSTYGILNLNSGTAKVYDISINGSFGSKVNIDNGTLTIPGIDYTTTLQSLVDNNLIVPASGKQIQINYDGTDTHVTATVPLGIEDNYKVTTNIKAYNNMVYVTNVTTPSEVTIYSITGSLVKSFKTNTDDNFSLKSGLYVGVIKTNEGQKSFKILLK